ncbi:MAG: hypothetical protein FD145_953 [Candidatus Saganbacteria bacterium]|uniref:Helix-turn-helix domain-containing protein n=1 Tax=Candidatus Saganbacteria bacterium TaxID=2575572 RepID=A0A833L0U6_UNCSA|nr:MAG: hypothetical protein FD145_953 [Candidatus Saganbacteria bacterium]
MKSEYLSIAELAKILDISRIAVYKRIKKGQIKAHKIGRNYAIPKRYLSKIVGKELKEEEKRKIEIAVRRTLKEYGEVLRLLGKE